MLIFYFSRQMTLLGQAATSWQPSVGCDCNIFQTIFAVLLGSVLHVHLPVVSRGPAQWPMSSGLDVFGVLIRTKPCICSLGVSLGVPESLYGVAFPSTFLSMISLILSGFLGL